MEVFRIMHQCPATTVRLSCAGRRQNHWELHPPKSSDPQEQHLMPLKDQMLARVPSVAAGVSLGRSSAGQEGAGSAPSPAGALLTRPLGLQPGHCSVTSQGIDILLCSYAGSPGLLWYVFSYRRRKGGIYCRKLPTIFLGNACENK